MYRLLTIFFITPSLGLLIRDSPLSLNLLSSHDNMHIDPQRSFTIRFFSAFSHHRYPRPSFLSLTMTSNFSTTPPQQQQQSTRYPPKALILSTSTQSISRAAARLRSGHLVSFPTETVYGLGCNALDPLAVEKIFYAKERPFTDPLILHVNEPQDAWSLWQAFSSEENYHTTTRSKEHQVLTILTQAFWPGPLTLVAKAASHIPPTVMANTGYVACRSPSHPIARALIQEAAIPIAAPSANKFGHVSPTRAQHVWDDLSMEDVWILDPTFADEGVDREEEVTTQRINHEKDDLEILPTDCKVGVESTVAKIEMGENGNKGKILILRHGAISAGDIQSCLYVAQLDQDFEVLDNMMQSSKETVSQVAPGQCIRHYSPNVPSFMVEEITLKTVVALDERDISLLRQSVVIDFGNKLISWKEHALAYRDLSVHGDASVAASRVFSFLRWSEQVVGAQRVFFPKLTERFGDTTSPLLQALKDRLTRAASGNVINSLKEVTSEG